MKRKDKLGVELERQNADDTSLRSEDESATTGDDSPEFNVMQPATEMPANIEKAYSATDTPEEIYAAEQLMNKHNSIGERVTAKEEMEELARLREEQEENPVNQSPAARLPPHRSTSPMARSGSRRRCVRRGRRDRPRCGRC